jgi:alpha-galactosidase
MSKSQQRLLRGLSPVNSLFMATLVSVTLLFCLALPFTVIAADEPLTGHWLHEDTNPDGNVSQIVLIFHQSGSKLTGKVVFSWGDLGFTDGTTDGHSFHFTVMTPADTEKPAVYDGKLDGDEIEVISRWPGNNNTTYRAKRAPDSTGVAPARIPPPPLHPVPYNGLAKTPPMGWNSWNHFQEKIDDAAVRGMADAMVASGMRDAGYVYINIDDTWEGKRDAAGNIQTNRKFPDMKALADYVHSKGLKIGIYSSPGPKTCGGYEGSYGYEAQDATTYAKWGIDYLKYDWCSAGKIYGNEDLQAVYQKMGEALQASDRPIVYSLCEYGIGDVWKWGPAVGANLWRTMGDIGDSWKSMDEIGFSQDRLAEYAAPGHWNDPDMLEIGNGGMTDTEYRTHFSLWALLAAPLLAGNDLRIMSAATKEILLNREVIAIDQDPAGHQAKRVSKKSELEVWERPLADGSRAIGLFNRGDKKAKVAVKWSDVGVNGEATVRDLWEHRSLGKVLSEYEALVPAHGVVLLKVSQN